MGENPIDAAVRELKEEIDIVVDPRLLKKICTIKGSFNYKRETISCFELILDDPPSIQLDHREVIWAEFISLRKALKLELSSPVNKFLLTYLAERTSCLKEA